MLQIHPNARTTPVTRAEIACSHERTGVLAQRYGVSTEELLVQGITWLRLGFSLRRMAQLTEKPAPAL